MNLSQITQRTDRFKKYKKICASIFLFSFIFSTVFISIPPKKADALFPVADWLNTVFQAITSAGTGTSATQSVIENVHQFALRPLAWALAKNILQSITAQTVNWINSGFNGNPAYVTNPDQFFLNIGDQTVSAALGANGGLLSKICTPFQPQIRLALVQNYLQETQGLQQCSISQVVKNYDGFINNFQNGGWQSWFAITQSQGGNPYSAYIVAQDQLSRNLLNKSQTYKDQLNQSKGFLSYEKCIARRNETPGATNNKDAILSGVAPSAGGQITRTSGIGDLTGNAGDTTTVPVSQGGGCLATETVTPGSVINDQLVKSLGSGIDTLNLSNDIDQIVGALLTQAIKGVVGGISGGLRGLSQSGSANNGNGRPLIQQILDQSQSQTDAQNKVNGIYNNLPASLAEAISTTSQTTSLTPVINESAIQNSINTRAAAAQAAAAAGAGGNPGNAPTGDINDASSTTVTSSNISSTGTRPTASTTTLTPTPVCGNNVCESGETTTSCSQDCTATGGVNVGGGKKGI